MANDRYYIERPATDDEGPEIVAEIKGFEDAVDFVADYIVRKGWADALHILWGDKDGPDETVARAESISVAENHEAFRKNAELVVTLDVPTAVPREFQELAAGGETFIAYGNNGVSEYTVYVQLAPDAEITDDAGRRYQLLELTPRPAQRIADERDDADDPTVKRFSLLELNPKKGRGAFTVRGERMYRHVLATQQLAAQRKQKDAKRIAAATVRGAASRGVPGLVRRNPVRIGSSGHEPDEIFQEDADAAIEKYKEFHRYDPKKVEEIRGLAIPRRVRSLGPAAYVLYRSGKVDPATLEKPKRPVDYIHEHDAGVEVYVTDGSADTDVPKSIYEATALVRLGYCLGFKLKDGTEAQGTAPLPDLCCTPDGKCLLIVQSKRKVLAMFWGGALGVFARGIDG